MDEFARIHELESILDPSPESRGEVIDIRKLRQICSQGITDDPSWIRPRAWRVLLSLLPPEKRNWDVEEERSRRRYWALVDGIAEEVAARPPPRYPLNAADSSLSQLAKSLNTLPRVSSASSPLTNSHESPVISLTTPDSPSFRALPPPTPVTPISPEHRSTSALLRRYMQVQDVNPDPQQDSPKPLPAPPSLTLSILDDEPPTPSTPGPSSNSPRYTTTLLPLVSPPLRAGGSKLTVSERRSICLLRIVHTHITLHPSHPPISQLVPLASALYSLCHASYFPPVSDSESDPGDTRDEAESFLEDVEVEAFWFLESIRDRVGEIWEGGEAMGQCLKDLSRRLNRTDPDFARELSRKALNPAVSPYSIKWLSSVLSSSLPPSSLYPLYDTLFSLPPESYIPHLADVMLTFILLLKPSLFAAGRAKGVSKTANLWSGEEGMENEEVGQREGQAMLLNYPLEQVGLGRILRVASEIKVQREWEESRTQSSWAGAVINTRFLGDPEPDDDDGATGTVVDSMRGLADAMRRSDAAASLAKVSTNWRAAALQAWSSTASSSKPAAEPATGFTPSHSSAPSWGSAAAGKLFGGMRISSITSAVSRASSPSLSMNGAGESPMSRSSSYSPPPRPETFHSPQDSYGSHSTPPPFMRPLSPPPSGRSVSALQSALSALVNANPSLASPPSARRSLPRPLILSTAARPASTVQVNTSSSVLNRKDSVSSATSYRTSTLSAASDSEGGFVRLRPLNGRPTVSPRSPAGIAMKRSFVRKTSLSGQTPLPSSPPTDSRPTSVDSLVTLPYSPPLPTPPPPSVSPAVSDAIHKWTLVDPPAPKVMSRSSSTSSLGSAYEPITAPPPPRRNRRMMEKRPPGLRLSDPDGALSRPQDPLVMRATPESQWNGEDTLRPSTWNEDGDRTPSPLTPTVARRPPPSPRKTFKKPPEAVLSDEESAKGDEEDNGYGDLLSAYEDDNGSVEGSAS